MGRVRSMTLFGWGVIVLFLLALGLTAYAAWRGAPFFPTPQRAVEMALELADVQRADIVIDLGAGDARVLIAATRRGAQAVGYELSPFLWLVGWLRILWSRSSARLSFRDGLRADLSPASVLFLFLTPRTLPGVLARIGSQLRPGTRIVSYAFRVEGLHPVQTVKPSGCGTLYLYTTPLSLPG